MRKLISHDTLDAAQVHAGNLDGLYSALHTTEDVRYYHAVNAARLQSRRQRGQDRARATRTSRKLALLRHGLSYALYDAGIGL